MGFRLHEHEGKSHAGTGWHLKHTAVGRCQRKARKRWQKDAPWTRKSGEENYLCSFEFLLFNLLSHVFLSCSKHSYLCWQIHSNISAYSQTIPCISPMLYLYGFCDVKGQWKTTTISEKICKLRIVHNIVSFGTLLTVCCFVFFFLFG